ncbi:MAG: aminopeptidase [Oscillospiraceae bacterium]|nr:aminopeptidase [Oscillospiraceae bacterium]
MSGKLKVYGLTGRSGSGKSTVLRMLSQMGVAVLDCDAIVREIEMPGHGCFDELVKSYPPQIITPEGELDRRKLADIAFASREETDRLNHIVHKHVLAELERRFVQLEKAGHGYCVVEAPQLFESGLDRRCDSVVLVSSAEGSMKRRIMDRDGLDAERADRRLAAQLSEAEFMKRCGIVIENNGDFEDLFMKVTELKKHFDTESETEEKLMSEEKKTKGQQLEEKLFAKNETAIKTYGKENREKIEEYSRGYMDFMNRSKTEREFAHNAVDFLKANGFTEFQPGKKYSAGDRICWLNHNKSVVAAVIGTRPLQDGMLIAAAHIDSPRIDIRPHPLYESEDIALFKTHYYGGIKNYQWVTMPLALHGVVSRKDGEVVNIVIGEDDDDPIFYISDLLPHLAGKVQGSRTSREVISAEELNIILGTEPYDDEKVKEPVKLQVLNVLNEKYGITEEDFISAELEIVPAMKARFVGFDKTLIAAYGHDDKICGYTSMTALAELKAPEKTCVLILADKEEIGSIGNTGMESDMLRNFTAFLCEPHRVMPEMVYVNSKCLSADVSAAFDPTFPMVHERMNAPYLNRGPAVSKYLGSGGKGGSNDAHAEYVGDLRRMWDEAGVPWQLTELGKLDEGGGGTVAKFISRLGIDTIDIGVPLLSMHSPYELAASLDLYSMDRAVSAFFRNM